MVVGPFERINAHSRIRSCVPRGPAGYRVAIQSAQGRKPYEAYGYARFGKTRSFYMHDLRHWELPMAGNLAAYCITMQSDTLRSKYIILPGRLPWCDRSLENRGTSSNSPSAQLLPKPSDVRRGAARRCEQTHRWVIHRGLEAYILGMSE